MELYMAGGSEFGLPKGGIVRAANITPDKETGIGQLTEDQFVSKFTQWRDESKFVPVGDNEFNTIMPWATYAHMTEQDLRAIYQYLMSLKPIPQTVQKFTPDA